jgi:hypothetical protein
MMTRAGDNRLKGRGSRRQVVVLVAFRAVSIVIRANKLVG